MSEGETQSAAAPPAATQGDTSQDNTEQEAGDVEATEADSDQDNRQTQQPTPEETPSGNDTLELEEDPLRKGPDEEADAGEDTAILEELLTDDKAPEAEPSGEETRQPTAPTAETREDSGSDQEPRPSTPSGSNETSEDETTDTSEVMPQGGAGDDGLDEATNDDADARAYEELVTGGSATGSEADEEILNLEEPAEEQDEEAPIEIDNEGQPAPASTADSPDGTGQTDAFDTGSVQTAGGLSDEERGDLEKLITGLKEASPDGISPAVMKGLRKQLKTTDQRVAKLGKMVVAYDRRLKACYEVIRLHQEKTEIMNRRIDALVAAMNNGKGN